MNISTLSPKYQIVIPREVRKSMNLRPGQRLQFRIRNHHIEIEPVITGSDLIGLLKGETPMHFEREGDRLL
jgi:AbrB family looped-hinge helix DNA binding protein